MDESKYKKKRDGHVRHIVHYINEDEGVSYDVDSSAGGLVTAVEYFPAAKDAHLRCPASGEDLANTTKFDSYSNISFESEKKRLDSFAEQLRRHDSAEGYIMVYAGRRARAGEAKARAERAKEYLIKVRGTDARRIVTIDGGHQEELMVELYLVPSGASPPPAMPTIDPNDVQIIKASSAKNNNRRSTRPRCKR
ncbi:MAG: hypothetical protein LC795_14245 [Acidobacteria bacterium]|nr:hypothetical protein [Acidobacteriota bacterium]